MPLSTSQSPEPADTPDEGVVFKRRRTRVRSRRRSQDGVWELAHPRCTAERVEDLEEVQAMLDAGETEVARDELRWLLEGCPDFIAVHRWLGDLALESRDLKLARGHFGHAVELGWSALPTDWSGPLPYRLPANQAYLEAAKGLAFCLRELAKTPQALSVVEHMIACDPVDPLGVRSWLAAWSATPVIPPCNSDERIGP